MLTRAQITAVGWVAGFIVGTYTIKKTLQRLLGGRKQSITLSNATKVTNDKGETIGYAYSGSDGKTYFDNGSSFYVWNGNEWQAA